MIYSQEFTKLAGQEPWVLPSQFEGGDGACPAGATPGSCQLTSFLIIASAPVSFSSQPSAYVLSLS